MYMIHPKEKKDSSNFQAEEYVTGHKNFYTTKQEIIHFSLPLWTIIVRVIAYFNTKTESRIQKNIFHLIMESLFVYNVNLHMSVLTHPRRAQ